ncbi:hypothetical protein QQ045_002262 [Rhodiola kirilowii]
MEPESDRSKKASQKGKAPMRKIQTDLSEKEHPLSIQEMKSIFSNMLGRELSKEEIAEIAEAPAKAENLIMNYRSLRYELNIMKKDHAELKQAVESCQPKDKGWWEVNVDELNSVEEVKEVATRAAEFQKLLVNHLENLKMKKFSEKKET